VTVPLRRSVEGSKGGARRAGLVVCLEPEGSLDYTTGPRSQCMGFLELERVAIPGRNGATFYPNQPELTFDYYRVLGWIEGFLSAANLYGVRGRYNVGEGRTPINGWLG
jgi:hypothetical protein